MLSMRHAAETAQIHSAPLSAVMHALMHLCSYAVMHARMGGGTFRLTMELGGHALCVNNALPSQPLCSPNVPPPMHARVPTVHRHFSNLCGTY